MIPSQKKEEVKKAKKSEDPEMTDLFDKAIDAESIKQGSDEEVQSIFERSSILSQSKDNMLGTKKSINSA